MAIAILKKSFHRNSTYTAQTCTDEISLLGQKVTFHADLKADSKYKTNKYLYILTYSVMVISLACCETFGAAIYTELARQLNVGTDVIAFIFTCKSISFAVSAMSCAWITDYFNETHRYISLTMLFSCISLLIIPYTHNTHIMYVLFIIIGYSVGAIYVCFPVYIFRLYSKRQSLMIYLLLSIYGTTKVILPLLIELSILVTTKYDLSLYIISFIGLFDCVCLLFVLTPIHDKLRTIKSDLANKKKRRKKSAKSLMFDHNNYTCTGTTNTNSYNRSFGNISDDHTANNTPPKFTNDSLTDHEHEHEHEPQEAEYSTTDITVLESETELEDISNQVSFVLRNNKKHVIYEWIVIVLLSLDMSLFSAVQSGSVSFITTYCDETLHINEGNGRFMMSCYFLGQLMYRLIFAVFIGDGYKKIFSPTRTISFGFVVMTIFSLIFVIWPKDIVVLYVVYSVSGAFGGAIFPDIYKWCECMRPVSGVLSCFYIIGFAAGDAVIVLVVGELFAVMGAHILPYPILITNFIGFLLTICIATVYSKYQQNKSTILSAFCHGR